MRNYYRIIINTIMLLYISYPVHYCFIAAVTACNYLYIRRFFVLTFIFDNISCISYPFIRTKNYYLLKTFIIHKPFNGMHDYRLVSYLKILFRFISIHSAPYTTC